jgi:hypothetical protein
VTNPAIDSIREGLVMSLNSYIGAEGNIFEETPKNCHTLKLRHPIISNWRLEKLRRVAWGDFLATTLPARFRVAGGEAELEKAVEDLCLRASTAVKSGYTLIILSDRGNAQPGRADCRIRRASRSHALRPAAGLWRQRRQSVSGH